MTFDINTAKERWNYLVDYSTRQLAGKKLECNGSISWASTGNRDIWVPVDFPVWTYGNDVMFREVVEPLVEEFFLTPSPDSDCSGLPPNVVATFDPDTHKILSVKIIDENSGK